MKSKPFLNGERIYLRPLNESDAEGNYINWFNDEEICMYNNHHRYPYSYQDAIDYIGYTRQTKDALILAIVQRDENIHIGNISLQEINFIHRTSEFAIVLGERQYWNKGYAKEAARMLINHGFSELNLNRISCGTYHTNLGMQKLAESLGFKKEGIRRSAVFKSNEYMDIYEYGILRAEWNHN